MRWGCGNEDILLDMAWGRRYGIKNSQREDCEWDKDWTVIKKISNENNNSMNI